MTTLQPYLAKASMQAAPIPELDPEICEVGHSKKVLFQTIQDSTIKCYQLPKIITVKL